MSLPAWQSAPDGIRIFIPDPVLAESHRGAEYSFSVWLERRQTGPLLLGNVTFSLNVAVGRVADAGSAALLVALLPAMRMGLPLRIEAPVSPLLLQHAREVQEIFSTWLDALTVVPVQAPCAQPAAPSADDGRGTACLFTPDVDGFHTLQRQCDGITDLLCIRELNASGDPNAPRTALEAVAARHGRPLMVVHTNAWSFTDSFLRWDHCCGFVAGAAAHLLANHLARVFVASSAPYDGFVPFGTNALTDPLLSSERLTMVHDGAEFSRLQKLEQLAQDPFVLQNLRVCRENEGAAQNCGRCALCLHAMTALSLQGVLDASPVFPQQIDLNAIRKLRLEEQSLLDAHELQDHARQLGMEDSPLMQAWEECLVRGMAESLTNPAAAFVKSLPRRDRELLLEDLRRHAPDALCRAAANHAGRSRQAVFDFLWKRHRPAVLRSLFKCDRP